MKQYEIINTEILLKVKKSPLITRVITFSLAALSFLAPVLGIIFAITSGDGVQFRSFFALIAFSLIGFYLLRISLWNTYGFERIDFSKGSIFYEANYGWFTDSKKEMKVNDSLRYSTLKAGFEEDKLGVLRIEVEDDAITSVAKMPLEQLEELIDHLEGMKLK